MGVLSTIAYLLIDYGVNNDGFAERLESLSLYSSIPKEFFLGLLIAMAFVNCPLFGLDLQLVFLHAWLMSQNLTTYEYIMNKRTIDEGGSVFSDEESKKKGRF